MTLDEDVNLEREFEELAEIEMKVQKEKFSLRKRKIPNWLRIVIGLSAFSAYETIDNLVFEGEHSVIKSIFNLSESKKTVKLYEQALEQSRLGEYNQAIESFDKLIEINPQNSIAWSGRGISLTSLRRYEEAIKNFNKAIEINPEYAHAWDNKGTALHNQGNLEEAIEAYNKAININSSEKSFKQNREGAEKRLVESYIKSRNYSKALSYCNKEIKSRPDNTFLRVLLGDIYTHKGDVDMAIVTYKRVADLAEHKSLEESIAYEKLGDVYEKKSSQTGSRDYLEEARHAYGMAQYGRSGNASLNYKEGLMESKLGLVSEAIKDYNWAIKCDPNYAEAHNKLGDEYINKTKTIWFKSNKKKEIYKAMTHYDKAIELQPNNQAFRNDLKRAKQILAELDE